MLLSSSPEIFAGLRVLLRLTIPRHPPTALTNLTLQLNKVTIGPMTEHPFVAFFKRRLKLIKTFNKYILDSLYTARVSKIGSGVVASR